MDNIEKANEDEEPVDPSILASVETLQASSLSQSTIPNLLPLAKVSLKYCLDSPTQTSPFSAKMIELWENYIVQTR